MAFFLRDSFDTYATATDFGWTYAQSGATLSLTAGRFGGGCAQFSPLFTTPLGFNFGTQTEIWSSFAIENTGTQVADEIVCCFVCDNSVIENLISYNPALGLWKWFLGANTSGTVLASGTYVLSSGYHWIDAHIKRSTTAGVVELWVDNKQIFEVTGLDNETQTSNNMVLMTLGNFGGGSLSMNGDDWHIQDTTTGRIGDSRIVALTPTSDAGPNNATPSTGTNHYACVNEANWSSSEYLTMPNTSGDKEVFGFGSLPTTPSTIWGVKVLLVSEKSDAGSFQVEPLVISNTHETDGSAVQLTTSYSMQSAMIDVDPNTSAPWTYGAVNAMTAGYKVP